MEGGFRDAPPLLPVVNDLQNASNTQTVNTDTSGNTNIENSFVHLSLSDSNPQLYSGVSSDTVSINLATIEIPAIHHSPTSPDHPGYTPSVQNPVLFSSYKIPNRRELSKSLPFGLLFTPVAPLDPAPPCLHKPVISCFACNASINRYCKVDLNTGGWTCIFCKAENCHKNEYGTSSSTSLYPELVKFVVEYMDPSKQPFPIMGGLLDPIYIFVVDLSIPKPDIEKLKDSIVKTVKSVAKGTRIGFMTISNVVSIYQLNAPGIASCRVLPGIVTPDPSAIRQIIDYIEDYFVPVENVWETIGNVFEAISSMLPNVKTVSPNAKRALGAAMETAVAMLTQNIKKEMKPLYSRIITFMSGSPNYGPGAIPDVGDTQTIEYHRAKAVSYYKEISLKAQEHDIGIDIFCIGLKQFNSNILQNLVLSNGGLVHMQKELLPEFSQNILMALSRTCGRQGSFEIRCSSSIVITHIIGSAVSDRKRSSEEETTSNNFFTMQMGGVQPKLCFTIHYELAEDIVDDFVYFQFIVNFINTQNQSITRVITRKIPTTGNFATFLSSVDQDVTSVLLAKSFVLKARKEPNITKINEQLDNELHQIAVKCGTANVNRRVYKLPETLYKLPRSLFLTRRGPLLGVLIQHADDLDSLRCMFLNATLEDSKRIMEPKLYMAIDDPSQMYYEVPLENLAMQSDKVLLMDNQTDIFIWSGRETTAPEFNDKRETMHKLAIELSKHRFPQPVIQQFKEGSSMARWFTCRLVPSHKDSPDEQIDAFPQLEELTQPQIAKLLSKFFKTDDLSYNQYCRTVLKL